MKIAKRKPTLGLPKWFQSWERLLEKIGKKEEYVETKSHNTTGDDVSRFNEITPPTMY